MILVGLTGGIGSGKSTVAEMFAQRGAVIIDGDAIARQLQRAGTTVLTKIVEHFGNDVLTEDGELNRGKLATIVFPDPDALKCLNAIVHPAIADEIERRIDSQRHSDRVVILDVALLVENPYKGLCGVIVIDVDIKIARMRLLTNRGMSGADIDARMARQATRETRNAIADIIIDNSFDLEHLRNEVARAWLWISQLPAAAPDAGSKIQ